MAETFDGCLTAPRNLDPGVNYKSLSSSSTFSSMIAILAFSTSASLSNSEASLIFSSPF